MQRMHGMHRPLRMAVMLVLIAFGAIACGAPTSTTHIWQATVQARSAPDNMLVFAGRMTEPTRRTLEDALVREITRRGTRATASYRVFAQLPQRDIAQSEVKRLGFDGAIVATLRQVKERQSYVPGHFHGGFWGGYYGPGWGASTWSPGYVVTDEIVSVETTFWDLRNDPGDLVWASNTETRNPSSTGDLVDSYVDEVVPNLERAGLVRPR